MFRSTSFAALFLLMGCSGATSSVTPADPAAGDGAGTTPPGSSSGGLNDAAPPSDGATSPDAEADGGVGGARLYPLALGYTWTYDVQPVGNGAVCVPGMHDTKVTSGPHLIAGKQAYEVAAFCLAAGSSQMAPAVQGDEVDTLYAGAWGALIDPVLSEGHTWPYFNTSYTWHKDSITVPAGTFTDCWTAKQNVTYTSFMTYCRGVGLVRSYSQDLGGNGWDAKLTTKSF